jgi:hypothetical protein
MKTILEEKFGKSLLAAQEPSTDDSTSEFGWARHRLPFSFLVCTHLK